MALRLAGRCSCGVSLDIVRQLRQRALHLACEGLKRCKGCRRPLPLSAFYRGGAGGVEGRCKRCKNARAARRQRRRYRDSAVYRRYRSARKQLTYWSDPELWRLKEEARARARGVRPREEWLASRRRSA